MAETVGACALAVVAYLALRPRRVTPMWSVKPVTFTETPAAMLDPVRDRIRMPGDCLPIRKHDGSDTTYEQDGTSVPPLPALPEHDPSPSTDDADAVALYLDEIQARLHLALDARYVAFCATLQVPVAAPLTVKHKARKGKRKNDGTAQDGTAQKEAVRRVDGGPRPAVHAQRGRRRVRGGVRVA